MKPPKSWLEEYASNHGRGKQGEKPKERASFGGNMDNSFRYYMARKIELQREQFGIILPPEPEPEPEPEPYAERQHECESHSQFFSDENKNNIRARSVAIKTPKPRKLRMEDEDESIQSTDVGHSMNSVLLRLKKKHKGSGRKQKLSSRKRRRKLKQNLGQKERGGVNSSPAKIKEMKESIPKESNCIIPKSCGDRDDSKLYEIGNTLTNMITSTIATRCQSQSPFQSPQAISTQRLKQKRKDLFFLGTTVLVNGYTNPSTDTIMRMLHKHGGNLEKYETDKVTHIIAESLSTAKAKIYKKQKRPIPVVKPGWIEDCVRAGRKLPHADYLLDEVKDMNVAASVDSFFKRKGEENKVRDRSSEQGTCQQSPLEDGKRHGLAKDKTALKHLGLEAKESPAIDLEMCVEDEWNFPPKATTVEPITLYQVEDESPRYDNSEKLSSSIENSETHCITKSHSKESSPEKGVVVRSQLPRAASNMRTDSPMVSSAVVTSKSPEGEESIAKSSSHPKSNHSTVASPSKPKFLGGGMRTVGTDPNFLDSYFSSSRLSFIGSFKQRSEKNQHHHKNAKRSPTAKRFVFHIDMDCFFAAIAVRNHPQYRDKPVAVGHAWRSDPSGVRGGSVPFSSTEEKKKSYSELSTCNYKAREFGVKKGMFLHRARQLCPDLVVLPYDYEGYEDASNKVGDILHFYVDEYQGAIEQVSCDESYLEFYFDDIDGDESSKEMASDIARKIGEGIRKEIVKATECTASIGIGPNKLLAKLATNNSKDCGGNAVSVANEWKKFLASVALREIPGIGYRMDQKLQSHGLKRVRDIWDLSEGELCGILGPGNGRKIHKFCHGEDDRPVKSAERKTIGAECNYGVRFDGEYGVDFMMAGLAKEVQKRMTKVGVLGRHMTVKVKERQQGAGPPGKFNGHGKCHDHSRSCNLPGNFPTRDAKIIADEAMKLFMEFGLDKNEIRGMGIVISKLESETGGHKSNGMSSWLKPSTAYLENSRKMSDTDINHHPCAQNDSGTESNTESCAFGGTREEEIVGGPVCSSNSKVVIELTSDNDDNEFNVASNVETLSNVNKDYRELCQPPKSNMSTIKSKHNARKVAKSHSAAAPRPRTAIVKSDGRYRQFDVKCMLKLASVKAGKNKLSYEGEQVSLTQLDSLPLEIQLQVANNDVSSESFIRRSRSRIPKSTIPESDSVIQEVISTDIDEIIEYVVQENEGDEEHSDINVLTKWMEEHKIPTTEDVELVRDFLCICVSEKRLDDVVCFLRCIRKRSDSWRHDHYHFLLKTTQQAIFSHQGRVLDLQGLGL